MTSHAISLVVPSLRRPERLRGCLAAIAASQAKADEVIVVHRAEDSATLEVARAAGVTPILVDRPGVLAAMRSGAAQARGGLVGFVDDDAQPAPDWLGRLLTHFDRPDVGGACGWDRVDGDASFARTADVGRVSSWGRLVGNHHRGAGRARDVDVLKAAGCLFRREALVLPVRLRGQGAEVHFEVVACLAARRRGWRLVYDPEARLDHLAGPRFDGDARTGPTARATRDGAHNLALAIIGQRPELAVRRTLFGLGVGDRAAPGVLRAGLAVAQRDRAVAGRLGPSILGQLEGTWAALSGAGAPLVVFDHATVPA